MKQLCAAGTAIILTLALAACGSSGSTSSAATGSTSTAGRQQARLALAQCLRARGVNVPDPGSGGTPGAGGGFFRAFQNIPPAQLRSARQACSSQLAAAFPRLNLSPAQQAQLRTQLVKFAECMRSHGIDIPDPQVGGGAGPGGFGFRRAFGSVDRNSPAFRTALTACQSLRPRFGRGGGPGAGPGA